MKKGIPSLMALFFILTATLSANTLYATVHIVQVGSPTNQFTPTSMTINLGDTVRFEYVSGFHTTTSTSVPAGAQSWDVPMQTAGTTFDYVPSVEGSYSYWCTFHQPAMAGAFTVSSPLPIKMSLLKGKLTKDDHVSLSWDTYEEQNNYHFEIQRSRDGLKFVTIDSLFPKGRSNNNITVYSYLDKKVVNDRVFYRLRQVDNDGRISYSNVVYLAVKGDKDIIVKIHPNPAKTSVMVHVQGNIPSGAEIQLTDVTGKVIDKVAVSAKDMNMPTLDISGLPSGIYLVKYVDKNQEITQKLTKE
ncbi:MAG TPA: T9SS type A sorting domain-containing protein [Edaphocola sp.]|nr:T9SS type A sorting domain-containing protein [Edaphocola sp.]